MSEWRPIVGYDDYEVSSEGAVRNVKTGRVLAPIFDSFGYVQYHLYANGVRKSPRAHRLVAEAFHGPATGPVVRHLDSNKLNNTPDNLRWGTHAENAYDMIRHGDWHNQNDRKTHCNYGHPLAGENLVLSELEDGRVHRRCRVCKRRLAETRKLANRRTVT